MAGGEPFVLQVKSITLENLEMEAEPIGCGSFKSVFRARLRGIQGEPDGTQVCFTGSSCVCLYPAYLQKAYTVFCHLGGCTGSAGTGDTICRT